MVEIVKWTDANVDYVFFPSRLNVWQNECYTLNNVMQCICHDNFVKACLTGFVKCIDANGFALK